MHSSYLLLSLLTRDEEIDGEELRLATAVNFFVQQVGRASELRKRIEDRKKVTCSISMVVLSSRQPS